MRRARQRAVERPSIDSPDQCEEQHTKHRAVLVERTSSIPFLIKKVYFHSRPACWRLYLPLHGQRRSEAQRQEEPKPHPHSAMVWYKICSMKEGTANYNKKMSAQKCLRNAPHETAIVGGNESECKFFHRYLAKYRGGTLLPTAKKRYRKSPYHAVAKKLVQYVEIRSHRFEYDKCGLNWVLLEAKLLQWAALVQSLSFRCCCRASCWSGVSFSRWLRPLWSRFCRRCCSSSGVSFSRLAQSLSFRCCCRASCSSGVSFLRWSRSLWFWFSCRCLRCSGDSLARFIL
jgi:hypothetical protein